MNQGKTRYDEVGQAGKKLRLLYAFGEHQVVPLGTVKLDSTTEKGHKENLLFYVTSSTDVPILGSKACSDMNMIKRVYACQPRQRSSMTKEEMKQYYKEVFTVVGQYEKRYHIQLDQDVEGVFQPPLKIPYATQQNLKVVLDKLKDQNITCILLIHYPVSVYPVKATQRWKRN